MCTEIKMDKNRKTEKQKKRKCHKDINLAVNTVFLV